MLTDITTERLRLRELRRVDLEAFVAYRRDPAIARYQDWSPDYSIAEAERLLAGVAGMTAPPPGEWMQVAVADKESDALVGDVAVHRLAAQPDTYELGATFSRLHHGKGYATEATAAVVDCLFGSCNAHRVFANTDGRNLGAQRVLRRLAFRHEGTAVDADFFKGEWTDLMTFAVLAREWPRRTDGS